MKFEQSYTYDDIGIEPCVLSEIDTRAECKPEITLLGLNKTSSLPIMVAPMEKVVGDKFIEAASKLGALTILPRTGSHADDIDRYENSDGQVIPSIDARFGYVRMAHYHTAGAREVCIDTANGFHIHVKKMVELLTEQFGAQCKVLTGNIASVEGYKFMRSIGVDAVRVGIGGGSVCKTSVATGIGVGAASTIRECARWRELHGGGPLIVADGGIKTPGDVVKAIALGADLVMAGRIFAGCEETPGPVVKFRGKLYKQYAGQASFNVKRKKNYVEGDDTLVPYTGTLEETWNRFKDGIVSGMSYMNAKNLNELRYLPDSCFRLLSHAALRERDVHA